MSLSPFAGLTYDARDEDLVRYRSHSTDDTLSLSVRSIFDSLDERRGDVRRAMTEQDDELVVLFARRRALSARRESSLRCVSDALDAYALLSREDDVPWESWFKATLFIGRDLGLDLEEARQRFASGATPGLARRADVAFDALARISEISQCHVVEVSTTYGTGLFETTVVRDPGVKSWGGITGIPVSLGQYAVRYAPRTNLAQLCVDVADALDATGLVITSPLHQDQLVAATFDLVESGSYLDSLGCLGFYADGLEGEPTFSVVVGEVASEEYDDVRYEAHALAHELGEAADAIIEQSAFSTGPCVVVASALPDFDEGASEEPVDLSGFCEVMRAAVAEQ